MSSSVAVLDDIRECPLRPTNELDALVEQILDQFPPLSDQQKAELGRLLASNC